MGFGSRPVHSPFPRSSRAARGPPRVPATAYERGAPALSRPPPKRTGARGRVRMQGATTSRHLRHVALAAVIMAAALAGCLQSGPPAHQSLDTDCPSGRAPLVPIQTTSSNWTAGVLVYTVRAVCGVAAMVPGNLVYRVLSANLTVFLNGTAGTGPEVLGARITLAFGDLNASGWVDHGDTFTLSVEPAEKALLLVGGRIDAFNDSRHSNSVGLAHIPFLGPPHVGLSVLSHSNNTSTITVSAVENIPPTPFGEVKIVLYAKGGGTVLYSGPLVAWATPALVTYHDADGDGAVSLDDQLVVKAHTFDMGDPSGGRIVLWFHLETLADLSPLP